jgi:hypothetical protein
MQPCEVRTFLEITPLLVPNDFRICLLLLFQTSTRVTGNKYLNVALFQLCPHYKVHIVVIRGHQKCPYFAECPNFKGLAAFHMVGGMV